MDAPASAPLPAPPKAARRPTRIVHHGHARNDDYAWLRAGNWREVMRNPHVLDKDIRACLEAENAYTEAAMADTRDLQAGLFAEMKGRIKEDDSSVPAPDGPFDYYSSYVTGAQHPRFCRRPRGGGDEQVLIDGNALAQGHAYFRLGGVSHSPDHELVAYAADVNGAEYYGIHIQEAGGGGEEADVIPDTAGGMVWAADGRSLFYVRYDDNHRPRRVFRHRLGTDPAHDALVYEEPDPGFYVGLGETQSRRFVVISAHDHQTSETRLIDAHAPDAPPVLVAPRIPGQEYSVEHHGDRLFVLTNDADAEDFKIVEAPLAAPGRENWRDMEAHKPGRLILDIAAFGGHLARLEREDGLPRIVVRRLADGEEHAIAFAEEAYSLGMMPGYEFDTTTLRFGYSSMRCSSASGVWVTP